MHGGIRNSMPLQRRPFQQATSSFSQPSYHGQEGIDILSRFLFFALKKNRLAAK
jgi:hypothetical protein